MARSKSNHIFATQFSYIHRNGTFSSFSRRTTVFALRRMELNSWLFIFHHRPCFGNSRAGRNFSLHQNYGERFKNAVFDFSFLISRDTSHERDREGKKHAEENLANTNNRRSFTKLTGKISGQVDSKSYFLSFIIISIQSQQTNK